MRTLKLTLEYDGTCFSGWQIQPRKNTVQQTVQDVLQKVTQENVKLVGASRTDTGVHALGQVAHFRTKSKIPAEKFFVALNGMLPPQISVKSVEESHAEFHAIRSAKFKKYRYLISSAKARSALQRLRTWHVREPLDVAAMRKAARFLLGKHDFSAFRSAHSDTKTSVRRLRGVSVRKTGDELKIEIVGDGFLKYMVRNVVGTLVDVGRGKISPSGFKEIMRSQDRKKAGATAPAFGLYLVEVRY